MGLDDVRNIIKHNMGLLPSDFSESPDKYLMVQEYGNKNVLRNKYLNYLFVVETA